MGGGVVVQGPGGGGGTLGSSETAGGNPAGRTGLAGADPCIDGTGGPSGLSGEPS